MGTIQKQKYRYQICLRIVGHDYTWMIPTYATLIQTLYPIAS